MAEDHTEEWEAMERDKRAVATQVVRDKRKDMIRQIRRIQPQAGKNLKDVEVPHSLFHLARDIVNDPEASLRFSKVAVYELLLGDLKRRARDPASPAALTLDNAGPVLEGWKLASTSLFRYALNLVLAPSRAEFKKMKLSTSFYVYNISRHLHHAEKALLAMGYRLTDKERKESQDLVYDGDVNMAKVLETATDLLVMHEEIKHLQENASVLLHSGRGDITLEHRVNQRMYEFSQAQQGSGNSGPPYTQSSRTPLPQCPPVATNPTLLPATQMPATVARGHENMHQTFHGRSSSSPKDTNQDYANVSGGKAVDQPLPSSGKRGYGDLTIGGAAVPPHMVNAGAQMAAGTLQQFQDQISHPQPQDHRLPQQAQLGESDAELYQNLPVYQQPDQQYSDLSQQRIPPSGAWQGRRASHPTTFQNFPHTSSYATGWDGAPNNQTVFQNVPSRPFTVSELTLAAPSGATTTAPPPSAVKPVPKPRSNVPSQRTSASEDARDEERLNIRAIMNQQQQSPDSVAGHLPPPITDFTSHQQADTPNLHSGLPSGVCLSGFPSSASGDDPVSLDPASSGPQGFGDTHASRSEDRSGEQTSIPPPLTERQRTVSSESSIDIYGSGVKKQYSRPSPLQEVGREGEVGFVVSPPATPTLMTQSSQEKFPRELKSEFELSSWRKTNRKSQSVDVVEDDSHHEDRGRQPLRSIKSGSNLAAMEGEVRTLEKPQPSPRRSRSPSPPCFAPSPSASPKAAPRERQTREDWTTAADPFPPGDPLRSIPKTLPRQAQSVEVASRNREVLRFSSGSNLLTAVSNPPPPPGSEYEPDTPVVGILPQHLMKKPGSTHPVGPQATHPAVESQSHTNCSEHLLKERELQEKERQQRLETDRQLQELQERFEREHQEKEAAQKQVRDLQLKLEQGHKESAKVQFLPQQKSVAVVSPTTAEAKVSLPNSVESRLDHGGGGGAKALREAAQQYVGEGMPRERANASSSKVRPKRPAAPSLEQETSFTEQPAEDISRGGGKVVAVDSATHVDLEDTWVCNYCTHLNADAFTRCDVCKRVDPRKHWVCHHCNNPNPNSLPQCETCRRLHETAV